MCVKAKGGRVRGGTVCVCVYPPPHEACILRVRGGTVCVCHVGGWDGPE